MDGQQSQLELIITLWWHKNQGGVAGVVKKLFSLLGQWRMKAQLP